MYMYTLTFIYKYFIANYQSEGNFIETEMIYSCEFQTFPIL
jgi:hypothetical protein